MTVAAPMLIHAVAALAYAHDVVEGREIACKWVRLACRRHLDDLASAESDSAFPFAFNEEAAERACAFIECLPHTKGKWAIARPGDPTSNQIRLERWQQFIIASLFGWVHRATGLRRFRKAYICVPRKNAKSTLAAGIGLYMFAADGEFGAEVYSGATSEKQAWEVFRPALLMAKRTARFLEEYNVEAGAKNLHIPDDGSRFEPVIGNPGDGASPSCAIVDEYHEHESDALLETMETGMGAREQPLLLVITTSGTNIESPCYALQLDVQRMLDAVVPNAELFGIVYTIDDGDDWTSLASLRKANPNYDISVSGDFLDARVAEAVRRADKQTVVKTKHLNIWCNARDAWMNLEQWNACADPSLREGDFVGQPCWQGLDMASRVDIASNVKVFQRDIDGLPHFYVFGRHYIPEKKAAEPDRAFMAGWVKDGYMVATDDEAIDHKTIMTNILDDAKRFQVVEIGFDPYDASWLTQGLMAEGLTVVEIQQRAPKLSGPMKEIEGLVASGRFHHDGNPALTWMVSNVVVKPDANDNIFPRKDRRDAKIDGAVALIMALSRAIVAPAAQETGWMVDMGW